MHTRTITHVRPGPVSLYVNSATGPVHVTVDETPNAHAEVCLQARDGGDEQQARVFVDDARIVSRGVEFVHIGHEPHPSRPSVIQAMVTLPRGSSVHMDTTALLPHQREADEACDLHTRGHLESVRYRGRARVVDIDTTNALSVQTSGGDIRANRADSVDAHTSGRGTIRIGGTSDADLHAADGDIDVHVVANGEVRARTSGGNIHISAAPGIEVVDGAKSSGGRVCTPNT